MFTEHQTGNDNSNKNVYESLQIIQQTIMIFKTNKFSMSDQNSGTTQILIKELGRTTEMFLARF